MNPDKAKERNKILTFKLNDPKQEKKINNYSQNSKIVNVFFSRCHNYKSVKGIFSLVIT